MDVTEKTIINFWFNAENKKRWFNSTCIFDEKIKIRFECTYVSAKDGSLNNWNTSADGALALVILLDQFPLNMYRNEAKAFETEALSREVARLAIINEHDMKMETEKRSFLYLPFMHSENREDQQYSVELFKALSAEEHLKFAIHHQKIIQKFGRFPHRNKILGRKNTQNEEEYLASSGAFLG